MNALAGSIAGVALLTTALVLGNARGSLAASNETHRASAAWRDPFWPPGYMPATEKPPPKPVKAVPVEPPREAPAPVADWSAAQKMLNVNAYGEREGVRWNLINGEVLQEGEIVSLLFKGMRYTWRILQASRDAETMIYEPVSFTKPETRSQ